MTWNTLVFTKSFVLVFLSIQIEDGIDMNILALIPSAVLGVLGGVMGSLFIFANLKFSKLRRIIHANVANERCENNLRIK